MLVLKEPLQQQTRTSPAAIQRRLWRSLISPRIWGVLTVLIAWQVFSLFMPPMILPAPLAVMTYLYQLTATGQVVDNLIPTMVRIVIGFLLTMGAGMGLGIIMGLRKYWESFFSLHVSIALVMPSITWAILGVMWFGMSDMTVVFGTFMIVLPYVAINIWEGVKSVPKELVEMGRSFGKTKMEVISKVFLPSLSPFLFAAMRFGFAMTWKIVIVAEMFVASSGVGYMIYLSYGRFSVKGILAWTLLFTILMIVLEYGFFRVLEKRALGWRPELLLR